MLTFFRRIRKGLLDGGAIRKYVLYAVGEILLVMIGILLALQVNNWNEQRKVRILEKNVLLEIRNALSSDLENQFDFHLTNSQKAIHSLDFIYKHLSQSLPYNDSLSFYFSVLAWEANKDWTPQNIAFESLKSKGIDLISTSDIKYAILKIYNLDYPHITKSFYTYKNNIENYGRPMLIANFLLDDNMFNNKQFQMKLFPINYNTLNQNVVLMNTIKFLKLANMGDKTLLLNYRKKVLAVIKAIDSELESK